MRLLSESYLRYLLLIEVIVDLSDGEQGIRIKRDSRLSTRWISRRGTSFFYCAKRYFIAVPPPLIICQQFAISAIQNTVMCDYLTC